jgi:hypothetical protein
VKGSEFQSDLGLGFLRESLLAWEIFFCVFVLFPVSRLETESAKSSCVAKPWAMESASLSLLSFSYAYVSELALVSARKSF